MSKGAAFAITFIITLILTTLITYIVTSLYYKYQYKLKEKVKLDIVSAEQRNENMDTNPLKWILTQPMLLVLQASS